MVSRCCWFVWVQTCKYARWSFSIAESDVARVICTAEIVACVYGRWVPHFSLICWLFSRNGKWLAVPGAMFHFPASVRSSGSSPSHRALNYSIYHHRIATSRSTPTTHHIVIDAIHLFANMQTHANDEILFQNRTIHMQPKHTYNFLLPFQKNLPRNIKICFKE